MGSSVSLDLGSLELDYSKGEYFNNHSKLFMQSNYGVINTHMYDDELHEKTGFSRTLGEVKLRLDLLGYKLKDIQTVYEKSFLDFFEKTFLELVSFEDFVKVVSVMNVDDLERLSENSGLTFYDYLSEVVFKQNGFEEAKEPILANSDDFVTFLDLLHPYAYMRLLAENPKNQHVKVMWRTHEIVEGRLVTKDKLYTGIDDEHKFLIITEGSSDLFIIKRAMMLLRPDVTDFFTYVDMKEHYPFTGTGSLYKFFQGLASIGMLNKCLFIFDNDAEGVEKYEKTAAIKAPRNLKVMKLPDLEEFSSFATEGPTGRHYADVNGKAVAIECFLDLSYKVTKEPVVRWSLYKSDINTYHGALEEKEHYTKQFKKVKSINDRYDFRKLNLLLNHIVDVCKS